MVLIPRLLILINITLVIGCGGGGGGGSSDSTPVMTPDPTPVEEDPTPVEEDPTPVEEDPTPIDVVDSVPSNGININPTNNSLHLAHLGQSDMTFSYTGDCSPSSIAIRRKLLDLASPAADQVTTHQITCSDLADSSSYTVGVRATRDNGAVSEASLSFGTTNTLQPSLTVQQTRTIPSDTVENMFSGYVEGALLAKLPSPSEADELLLKLILDISEANWQHLVRPEAIYDVVSHKVMYRSRAPDGAQSDALTGLIAFPETSSVAAFTRRDRIIVLTHATGSTPSELNPADAWYILANQFASRGYLVIAPDNWGRGATSTQPETYLMGSRTAYNGLDLLKATLASDDYQEFFNKALPDISVVGYSQGGHSAIGLWLLIETSDINPNINVKEVYSGGAPHNLYQTFRGVLQHLDGNCNDGAYCRFVNEDTTVPFAVDRIIPGIITYTNTGLVESDLIDGDGLADSLIQGFLTNDPAYDAFKVVLQLNSFTNVSGLAAAVGHHPDTLIKLYHSRFDRLVPVENTEKLAKALSGFNVDFHENRCNSRGYEVIFNTIPKVGAVHTICGLSVLEDAMEDLR